MQHKKHGSSTTGRFLARLLLCGCACLAPLLSGGPESAWPGFAARADDGDDAGPGGDGSSGSEASAPQQRDQAFRELVVAGATPALRTELQKRGFTVVGQRHNQLLGQSVLLLRVPLHALLSDPAAEVRSLDPNLRVDHNHYYRSNDASPLLSPQRQHIAWPGTSGRCTVTPVIGLIDTHVDTRHAALRGASIRQVPLPGQNQGERRSRPQHGTAIAAMLVGQTPTLRGLLPRARLVAVDAFHRGQLGDERMSAWDLVAAMDALVAHKVRIINMSFAGAHNQVLERALDRVHQRRIMTVAAVGNRGPHAAPQYPAAYADVLAVTAVNQASTAYHRAGRGPHVDLAAPGVEIPVADADRQVQARSGTSYAAPFVTAAAAGLLYRPGQTPASVVQLLQSRAKDLGDPGHDPIYGHGLLQMDGLC